MFELTIFPLLVESGREQYELPGLLVAPAPRKPARIRAQDQLVLYWKLIQTPTGKMALSASQQQEMLRRLSETYFTTTGSVTAGLRAVVIRLNDFLLNRNLKNPQEGQWVGALNLGAIHNGSLFIAHAGPTHSFVLTQSEVVHFNDSQGLRGLGLSRQAVPRFYQADIKPGDLLIVCSQPPQGWTEKTLANSPQLSLDHLRRRLLSENRGDLHCAITRFQEGKGQVTYWRPADRSERRSAQDSELAADAAIEIIGSDKNTPAVQPAAKTDWKIPSSVPAENGSQTFTSSRQAVLSERDDGEPGKVSAVFNAIEEAALEGERNDFSDAANEQAHEDSTSFGEVPGFIPPWEEIPDQPGGASESTAQESPKGVFLNRTGVGVELSSSSLPRPVRPDLLSEPSSTRGIAQQIPLAVGEPVFAGNEAAPVKTRPDRKSGKKGKPAKTRSAKPSQPNPVQRWLAAVWQKGSAARLRAGSVVAKAAARVFPQRQEPLINVPASALVMIAVAIPMIVVAVSTTVYLRAGREEQYGILFGRAQQYALTAEGQEDPVQLLESWGRVYELVRDAEAYGKTDESLALKQRALAVLDEIEGLVRLQYQPVIAGGLGNGVNITKMVATPSGIYMLDAASSSILHLNSTLTGYDIDAAFRCGSGKAGSVLVGEIIDIAALPLNNDMRAAVMGIDSAGTLVYCSSSADGFSASPLALPDAGWGEIKGITTAGNTLYVLDPKMRAVYWYDGQNGIYGAKPHLYFDQNIPNMEDVIDLAVDPEFLYLLHADGKMTVCESSGFAFAPTRCTDPAPYGDNRSGFEPSPLTFASSRLSQLQTSPPPDPSLFALDEMEQSIYHLSLRRLNLQRQYRPVPESDFPLPDSPPTAYAVTQNRRALLAFGNQIFFAPIP